MQAVPHQPTATGAGERHQSCPCMGVGQPACTQAALEGMPSSLCVSFSTSASALHDRLQGALLWVGLQAVQGGAGGERWRLRGLAALHTGGKRPPHASHALQTCPPSDPRACAGLVRRTGLSPTASSTPSRSPSPPGALQVRVSVAVHGRHAGTALERCGSALAARAVRQPPPPNAARNLQAPSLLSWLPAGHGAVGAPPLGPVPVHPGHSCAARLGGAAAAGADDHGRRMREPRRCSPGQLQCHCRRRRAGPAAGGCESAAPGPARPRDAEEEPVRDAVRPSGERAALLLLPACLRGRRLASIDCCVRACTAGEHCSQQHCRSARATVAAGCASAGAASAARSTLPRGTCPGCRPWLARTTVSGDAPSSRQQCGRGAAGARTHAVHSCSAPCLRSYTTDVTAGKPREYWDYEAFTPELVCAALSAALR